MSRQCQGNVKVISRQGQGQEKVKTRSGQVDGKVNTSSRGGSLKVKARTTRRAQGNLMGFITIEINLLV